MTLLTKEKGTGGLYWKYIPILETYETKNQRDQLRTFFRLRNEKSEKNCAYLMGPYNTGPKSALFLRVAEIRAGVKRAGVKWAIFWLENSKKRR